MAHGWLLELRLTTQRAIAYSYHYHMSPLQVSNTKPAYVLRGLREGCTAAAAVALHVLFGAKNTTPSASSGRASTYAHPLQEDQNHAMPPHTLLVAL